MNIDKAKVPAAARLIFFEQILRHNVGTRQNTIVKFPMGLI